MKIDIKRAFTVNIGIFFLIVFIGGEMSHMGLAGGFLEVIVGVALCASTIMFFLLLPFYLREKRRERNSPENVAARAAKQAELEAQYYAQLYAEGKIVIDAKFLGNGMTLQKRGGLGDYLWGDFVAGPVGGMIAANSVKSETQLVSFAVLYSDQHIEIEQVLPNSKRFQELIAFVKWEEIEQLP